MNTLLQNMTTLKSEIKINDQVCGIEIERHQNYMQANLWFFCAFNDEEFKKFNETNKLDSALTHIPISVQPISHKDSFQEAFDKIADEVSEYVEKISKKIKPNMKYIPFDSVVDVFNDSIELAKAQFGHACNLKMLMQVITSADLQLIKNPIQHNNEYLVQLEDHLDNVALRIITQSNKIIDLDIVVIESTTILSIQKPASYIIEAINEFFTIDSNCLNLKSMMKARKADTV